MIVSSIQDTWPAQNTHCQFWLYNNWMAPALSSLAPFKTAAWSLVILLASSNAWSQQTKIQIRSAQGSELSGTIESINQNELSILTENKPTRLLLEQVNSIRFEKPTFPTVETMIRVQLVDGSWFNASSVTIDSRILNLTLRCGLTMSVDARNVAHVQFRGYKDELKLADQWREILADSSRIGDAIVVNRSDELNSIEGIVGDLSDQKLSFSIEDRTAEVAVDRIDAVLFYHAAGRELQDRCCELVLVDNSKLQIHDLNWYASRLQIETACGVKTEIPASNLARIDFSANREVWLSDLAPLTNDWQPLMTSSAIVDKLRKLKLAKKNQSHSGQPLRLRMIPDEDLSLLPDTREFRHGYSMQSGGKLTFGLNREFRKLTGMVGFDPSANLSGQLSFKILVDGKTAVEKELIHRSMKQPLELDLDIQNADRIVFQVDYLDGRSIGDQLNLVDLKVAR